MMVKVSIDSSVSLEDIDNFQRFIVVAQFPQQSTSVLGDVMKAAGAGRTDTNHAWVTADWLIRQSGRVTSETWMAQFVKMCDYGRLRGWVSEHNEIRGHIEWINC